MMFFKPVNILYGNIPSQECKRKSERPRHSWLHKVMTWTTHCRLSSLSLTGMENSQWRSHNTFGDRCSATAGPHLWNSLPSKWLQSDSLSEFKRLLKTHLLGDHGASWHAVKSTIYKSCYLLT